VRGDLAIKIFGPDLETLNRLATDILSVVETLEGSEDAYTLTNDGVQYLQVDVDRLAAGQLGFSMAEVQDFLRLQLQGEELGTVTEGDRRTPIHLRGHSDLRKSPGAFSNLHLLCPRGECVPLTSIARVERVEGQVKIDREMGSRFSVVIANVTGRDLVGFVDEAKSAIAARVDLPEGYRLAFGGQFENQQRAAARLGL